MKIPVLPQSNAAALASRNFEDFDAETLALWSRDFVSLKHPAPPLPHKLILELVNSCNLDCPMCRVGQYGIDFSRTMPLAVVTRLLSQLPSLKTVRINGLGESTILPNFIEYIDIIEASSPCKIELITNGTGPISSYERVLSSGGKIYFSWDAASPSLFEKLRRPAKWEVCYATLESTSIALVNQKLSGSTHLLFTFQATNILELPKVVEIAKKLNISTVVVNLEKKAGVHWVFSRIQQIREATSEAIATAQTSDVRLLAPSHLNGQPLDVQGLLTAAHVKCEAPWTEALVRYNGDIQSCNMFNPYTYGNIHLSHFQQIWTNRFAQVFRANLNSPSKHPYCRGCVYTADSYD